MQIDPLDENKRKNLESVNIVFAAKHKLEQVKYSWNSAKMLEFKNLVG